MKYLLLVLLLSSCAEIRKVTNTNAITEENQRIDAKIKTLATEAEASSCKFITDVKGEDNLLNSGKESAIISIKKFAAQKNADTIWVSSCTETETGLKPVMVCKGKAYACAQ